MLALKMEGTTAMVRGQLLEAETGPWLTASREMGPQSYNHKELKAATTP